MWIRDKHDDTYYVNISHIAQIYYKHNIYYAELSNGSIIQLYGTDYDLIRNYIEKGRLLNDIKALQDSP